MQEVQPKLKELQKKYKDDKQTLNSELMALYQQQGINPVGGCLPMVAQLPVFLVLFNVLRGLSRRVSETPYYAISERARDMVGGASVGGDTFDPKYLSPDSSLYTDLSRATEMRFGPFDLAERTLDVIQSNILVGIPYVLLILFVVGTSYYQQRQVSARRSGSTAGMNPQQEMILKAMPLLSGVWSFVFPAGLVLYWATSNAFRIGQQFYITRAFYAERDADGSSSPDSGAEVADTVEEPADTVDEPAGNRRNGQAGRSRSSSKGKPATAEASTNGHVVDASHEDVRVPATASERREAWARRRQQQQARSQSKARNKTESATSRVTPKGTKPGGSRAAGNKKKRKR
jgi:YidC/Oxa1 family membrane protein insertase